VLLFRLKLENNKILMRKGIRILLITLLVLVSLAFLMFTGVVVAGFIILPSSQFHGTWLSPPKPAADFNLQSAAGMVHLADFQGKVVMLYFGYTFCPDHCPLTLSKIKSAISMLTVQEVNQVRFVMVSVDPERDKIKKITDYVHAFRSDFIGLTGTPSEIDDAAKKYGIYYKKNKTNSAAGYLIDHTTSILVLDKQGRLCLIWPGTIESSDIASDLKILIAKR